MATRIKLPHPGILLELNSKEFNKTFEKYMSLCTSKTLPEALNTKAAYIIHAAGEGTKLADKGEIRKWVRSKDGQNWIGSLFGREIMMKYVRGKSMPASRKEATKRIIAARIASVGYIKAGWTRPLGAMRRAGRVKIKNIKGAKQRKGQILGTAVPAKISKRTFRPTATFTNAAGAQKNSDRTTHGSKYSQADAARAFGEPALGKAFAKERASMKVYIERKLQEAARKTGAA